MSHAHLPSHDERPEANPYLPLAHHGRTRASWVGSMGAMVGFIIAAIGFILPDINIPVIVVGFVVVLASAIAGGILRQQGHGALER